MRRTMSHVLGAPFKCSLPWGRGPRAHPQFYIKSYYENPPVSLIPIYSHLCPVPWNFKFFRIVQEMSSYSLSFA